MAGFRDLFAYFMGWWSVPGVFSAQPVDDDSTWHAEPRGKAWAAGARAKGWRAEPRGTTWTVQEGGG